MMLRNSNSNLPCEVANSNSNIHPVRQDKQIKRHNIDFDFYNLDIEAIDQYLKKGILKEVKEFNASEISGQIAFFKKLMLLASDKLSALGYSHHRHRRIEYKG